MSRQPSPCMLRISGLTGGTGELEILKGIDLELEAGETLAIMGPNGSGKSTLASLLAGHPGYLATGGAVTLDGQNLLDMAPEQRAAQGLFLAFQYPASVPGVPVSQFLRLCLGAQEAARGETPTTSTEFLKRLRAATQQLKIKPEFMERGLNDGFSGGEKKRLEMLQMLVLRPRLVILDEIDSGLDIDAIQLVSEAVNSLERERTAVLVITHYQRLLNYIKPDQVNVMKGGRIVRQGGPEVALELERTGYGE